MKRREFLSALGGAGRFAIFQEPNRGGFYGSGHNRSCYCRCRSFWRISLRWLLNGGGGFQPGRRGFDHKASAAKLRAVLYGVAGLAYGGVHRVSGAHSCTIVVQHGGDEFGRRRGRIRGGAGGRYSGNIHPIARAGDRRNIVRRLCHLTRRRSYFDRNAGRRFCNGASKARCIHWRAG